MIGRRKYWVKDSVTKKKLAGFVNQKLKKLGYKTKKLRYRRTFKQAQANGLRPTGRELYPGSAKGEVEIPKKVGPRAPARAGILTSKKPFPFQKKSTEQELEELQKRREPENIDLFQYTKDVLLDLAKKANISGRSTMNKSQLVTALSNLRDISRLVITPEVVKESEKAVVENKQKEEKEQEEKISASERDFTYKN